MSTLTTAKDRLIPVFQALKQPNAGLMLAFGFSSGLPFLLTGATLGFWLRQEGISLTLIGFLSWVSLLYGFKVVWAPWMDKVRLPFLYDWLGQRRSFMLLAQVGVAAGLVIMAAIGPQGQLIWFAAAALFVAFAAASQEIAIDAWRVEQTQTEADQALNPSLYAFGFRIAILTTDALILFLAARVGWPISYMVLAFVMVVGITATLFAKPSIRDRDHIAPVKGMRELVVEPFVSFFAHHKWAGMILLTLALYRLPDYLIGPVAAPLYQDTSLSNDQIAAMRATVGLWASFIGIAAGGSCLLFFGVERAFLLGAILGPLSNVCFALMAMYPGDLRVFGLTLIVDNVSNGMAETALVAFMTRFTGKDYTLTHYALMYSVCALTGKFLKGFSGQIVDQMTPMLGLFGAYQQFFIGTAVMGVPAVLGCLFLSKKGVFRLKTP